MNARSQTGSSYSIENCRLRTKYSNKKQPFLATLQGYVWVRGLKHLAF